MLAFDDGPGFRKQVIASITSIWEACAPMPMNARLSQEVGSEQSGNCFEETFEELNSWRPLPEEEFYYEASGVIINSFTKFHKIPKGFQDRSTSLLQARKSSGYTGIASLGYSGTGNDWPGSKTLSNSNVLEASQ